MVAALLVTLRSQQAISKPDILHGEFHASRLSLNLERGGYIAYSLSNKSQQKVEDSQTTGAYLEKYLQDKIFKQLDEVPWSLVCRSRKSKKVARSGTTTSWENRVGRNQFGHKSSRSLEAKPFPPGNLHQNFLGLQKEKNEGNSKQDKK